MIAGTRFYKGLTRPGPKTGRFYGHIVATIRSMRAPGQIITAAMCPIELGKARAALRHLYCIGELEQISTGTGRGNQSVYRWREQPIVKTDLPKASEKADTLVANDIPVSNKESRRQPCKLYSISAVS